VLRSVDLPDSHDRSWTASLILLAAGLVALVVVYDATWSATAGVWASSETFNHGFLVAPISGWLIWRQRANLAAMVPSPSWLGLGLLLLACTMWLVAELAGINVLASFAVVLTVPAMVMSVLGLRVAWAIAFPLAFLFFMVPAGEGFNPLLMEATADATVWAVAASGVPVYREGLHFALPTGRWSVVEACSGLRYLIAAGVLATLFAYLNFTRFYKRAVFIAVALFIAVVANWARAYLIVMIGHLSGMRLGVGDDHVYYGWVFFGITMFAVFWMGARWQDPAAATGPTGICSGDSSSERSSRNASPVGLAMTALSAVVILAATHLSLQEMRNVELRTDLEELAAVTFRGFKVQPPALVPRYVGARHVVQGESDVDTGTDIYVAYFARQSAGSELIAFGNTVLEHSDPKWQLLSRADRLVEVEGTAIPVREWRVRSGPVQRVVWSWYTVGGRSTSSEYRAKALTAWAMLTGRGDHSTITAIATRVPDSAGTEDLPSDVRARLDTLAVKATEFARSATSR
jgi:exosortase A